MVFCHPVPSLDHPNVLSYIDALRRDANVGNRITVIGAEGIEFDAKRWMEDWGLDGTNKSRAGLLPPSPPKGVYGDGKNDNGGGWRKRGSVS